MKDELINSKEVAMLLGRHDQSWTSLKARQGELKGVVMLCSRRFFRKSAIYEQFNIAGSFDEELYDRVLVGNAAIGRVCRVSGDTMKRAIESDASATMGKNPIFRLRNGNTDEVSYQTTLSALYKWLGLKGKFECDLMDDVRERIAKEKIAEEQNAKSC